LIVIILIINLLKHLL